MDKLKDLAGKTGGSGEQKPAAGGGGSEDYLDKGMLLITTTSASTKACSQCLSSRHLVPFPVYRWTAHRVSLHNGSSQNTAVSSASFLTSSHFLYHPCPSLPPPSHVTLPILPSPPSSPTSVLLLSSSHEPKPAANCHLSLGLDAGEKKFGAPVNRETNEKITDKGREMFEKSSGYVSDIPFSSSKRKWGWVMRNDQVFGLLTACRVLVLKSRCANEGGAVGRMSRTSSPIRPRRRWVDRQRVMRGDRGFEGFCGRDRSGHE